MPYNLLWPVSTRLDAGIPEAKVVEEVGGMQILKKRSCMSLWWLFAYQLMNFVFSGFACFNG